jgi:hypothetical protein
MLAAQAPWKQALQQHTALALRTLGLPSRSQVVSVAGQLVALEERIEGLEDRLDELKGLISQTPRGKAADEALRPGGRPPGSAGRGGGSGAAPRGATPRRAKEGT